MSSGNEGEGGRDSSSTVNIKHSEVDFVSRNDKSKQFQNFQGEVLRAGGYPGYVEPKFSLAPRRAEGRFV